MNKVTKIAMGAAFASMVIGGVSVDKANAATYSAQNQSSYVQTQGDYEALLNQFNVLEGKYYKLWDYSENIKPIQKAMNYFGYQPGCADGILGPRTSKALSDFQRDHGNKVTGNFDSNQFYAIRYALQVNKPKMTQQVKSQSSYLSKSNNVPVAQPVSNPTPPVSNPAPVTNVTGNPNVANSAYGFSQSDLDMLAHIVYGEARGESYEGQVAVAAVVLNRVKSPIFANSIAGVIYEPWAFTAVSDGQFSMTPNAQAYQAAQAAIKGWDPTNGSLYYWNPITATSPWVWSRSIIKTIGQHVFAI